MLFRLNVVFLILFPLSYCFSQNIWINEIDYDNVGSDNYEFIELAGDSSLDLNNFKLEFYNGGCSCLYDSYSLEGKL